MYSASFQAMVRSCLVKDPASRRVSVPSAGFHPEDRIIRPTAKQLLQSPFFKNVKKKSYLVSTLLSEWYDKHSRARLDIYTEGLPPLVDRQERRKYLTQLSLER